MTHRDAFARLAAASAVAVVAAVAVGSTVLIALRVRERVRQSVHAPPVAVERQRAAGDFVAAEAATFQNAPVSFAMDPRANRRPRAHPRTLATWRMRRAFPGAPPRIPHALTSLELLTATCNTCHARGGYAPRFGAFAPVTPHATLQPCTQCHVSDSAGVGIALPGTAATPDAACRQCHFPPGAPARSVSADISTSQWPRFATSPRTDAPPVIPHDVEFRGNCQACHTGPGAVEEIRTSHPERTSCRQCHVQSDEGALR